MCRDETPKSQLVYPACGVKQIASGSSSFISGFQEDILVVLPLTVPTRTKVRHCTLVLNCTDIMPPMTVCMYTNTSTTPGLTDALSVSRSHDKPTHAASMNNTYSTAVNQAITISQSSINVTRIMNETRASATGVHVTCEPMITWLPLPLPNTVFKFYCLDAWSCDAS